MVFLVFFFQLNSYHTLLHIALWYLKCVYLSPPFLSLQQFRQLWLFHRLLHQLCFCSLDSNFASFNSFSILQTEWPIYFSFIFKICADFLMHNQPSSLALCDCLLNFITVFPIIRYLHIFISSNEMSLNFMNAMNCSVCSLSYNFLFYNYLFLWISF